MKNKIMRVRHSNLKIKDSIFYLKNNIFNGYAYQFDEIGVFISQWEIQQGRKIAETNDLVGYVDPREGQEDLYLYGDEETIAEYEALCSNQSNIRRIDRDYLKITDDLEREKLYFNDEEFVGVYYWFDEDGFLILESFTATVGTSHAARNWLPSGQILENSDGYPMEAWYDNGQLKNQHYRDLNVSFTEDGKLRRLSKFEKTCEITDEQLRNFQLNHDFTLAGESIDDAFIRCFLNKENIKNIHNLYFRCTSITSKSLTEIDLSNINKLNLSFNRNLNDDVIPAIRSKYPGCAIIFQKPVK